jgi:four helix bundle protein
MMAYERFKAWRLAHQLALEVFSATDRWPRVELYGVTSQTRRAGLSIPTNIAEGAAKRGGREFGRYLDIALGSLAELSYLLRFARERQLLADEEWKRLEALRDEVGRLVYGLYRRVRRVNPRLTA